MTTLYQDDIDSAQEDIAAAGAAVAFARDTGRTYNSATGVTTGTATTAAGSAIEAKGSVSRFTLLGLVLVQPVTLLIAAKNLAGFIPVENDIMLWAGVQYTVKDVQRVGGPDGSPALYRVTGSR